MFSSSVITECECGVITECYGTGMGNGFINTSVCALLDDTKFDALVLLEIFAVVNGTRYVNDHVLIKM